MNGGSIVGLGQDHRLTLEDMGLDREFESPFLAVRSKAPDPSVVRAGW